MHRMRGRNALWILGTDHAGIAHPGGGREGAARRGHRPPRARPRGASSSGSGSGRSSTARRSSSSTSGSAPRSTTSASASPSTRATCAPSTASSLGSTRRATSTATTTWSTGTRARAPRSPTSRSRTARSPTPSTRSTTRSRAPTGCSPSPPCGRRRCSPTPRWRSIPTTSATGDLVGAHCVLPLVGRRLPVIADEHVDPEFGTGALKITPGHDPNDFEIGRAHGLEEITVIGEDGRMSEAAGERFAGLTVAEAQRGGRRGAARARGGLRPRSPTPTRPVLAPLRRADRAADLAAVVLPHGRAGAARDRGGRARTRCGSRRSSGSASTSTGWTTSAPGASPASSGGGTGCPVWYCGGEETYVAEERPARAMGWRAGRGRARHLVLLGAVAVRDAGLARRHPRAARLLPDRRPDHRARHHLPLGRADDHDRDRVRRRRSRSATSTSTR